MKRFMVAAIAALTCTGLLAQGAFAVGVKTHVKFSLSNDTGHLLVLKRVETSPRAEWDSKAPTILLRGATVDMAAYSQNGTELDVTYEDDSAIRVPSIYMRHTARLVAFIRNQSGLFVRGYYTDDKPGSLRMNVKSITPTEDGLWIRASITRVTGPWVD